MADPEELITIYRAANVTEAHLLRNILDEAEIEARVTEEMEPLAGLDITGPEVLVHLRDKARALEVIAHYEDLQVERAETEDDDEEEDDEFEDEEDDTDDEEED